MFQQPESLSSRTQYSGTEFRPLELRFQDRDPSNPKYFLRRPKNLKIGKFKTQELGNIASFLHSGYRIYTII